MQVQMQAFGRKQGSLRKLIAADLMARPHPVLYLQEFQSPERKPGWSKILGKNLPGTLNLKWEANSRMLTARTIAKRGNTPHELLGVFIAYLIERHGRKVSSVNIQLR